MTFTDALPPAKHGQCSFWSPPPRLPAKSRSELLTLSQHRCFCLFLPNQQEKTGVAMLYRHGPTALNSLSS